MLSAAVASAAPQVATPAECNGTEQMVSFQTPLPGNLAQAMSQFIEAHPQWDQYRLMRPPWPAFCCSKACNNATSHAVTSAACLAAGSSLKKSVLPYGF